MAEQGKYIYEWPRPMVTVDAAVFNVSEGKPLLLMINRKNNPYKDMWAIPGGFMEMDEELEDAVARELEEETGLTGVHLEQMRTFGTIGRDPRGRQITVVYMGIVDENNTKIKAGDDAAQAKWFDVDDLPKNIAFDHDKVTKFAIEKFREIYGRNN